MIDLSHLCGASARGLGDQPIGPCILRAGHDGTVHQDADGVRWSATVEFKQPAATVDPEDVPDELIALASEAHRTAPQMRDGQPTRMRHALAAVIPAIRSMVADEIEAALAQEGDGSLWDGGMDTAARIARGEATTSQVTSHDAEMTDLRDRIDAMWDQIHRDQHAATDAHAALDRVRALAIAAQERADRSPSRQIGGAPFPAHVPVSEIIAALDPPKEDA